MGGAFRRRFDRCHRGVQRRRDREHPHGLGPGHAPTALDPDEIITAVRFPIPDMAGYSKFRSQASRFALVGVFVARFGPAVRVAVTGAAPFVFRSKDIEGMLAKDFSPAALARASIAPSGLNSDIHADSEYRAHLVIVMARRAVEQALTAKGRSPS